MEITQLQYFLKLASIGHMSNTAEELNISQPALSSNIKKLEAEIGVELFTRHGRRIELNEYGTAFSQQLSPIIDELTACIDNIKAMKYSEESQIVIDAEPIYTFYDLPIRMNEVLCSCGGANLVNVRFPIRETFKRIIDNEIDFAVMGIDMDDPQIEKTLLSKDELVMIVHNSHPLAKKEWANLSEFSNDKFAMKTKDGLKASYNMASEKCCLEAGFKPNIVFQSPSRNELLDTVRSFHYSMLTPINTLSRFRLDGLSVIHISEPQCYSCLWLYRKKGKQERRNVKILREALLDFFQQNSGTPGHNF